jgi:hypothetical protein
MSTKLQDFPHAAILGGGLTPRTVTASLNGSAVDLIAGDGRCFAIQQVGAVSGTTPTLAGKLQESADGSTNWTDISGATFTTTSTTDNVQAIAFDRTLRYVRYVGTVAGTSPSFALAVIVSEQKKQI